MLVDHNLKLAGKLGLLIGTWLSSVSRHAGHILDNSKTHFVTGTIKQIRLDFNLQ